ncbi:MAG: AAA family ATPase [Rickettsiales bacterium]|nr:AAA family ATPase [Rickettsiales bacterium]
MVLAQSASDIKNTVLNFITNSKGKSYSFILSGSKGTGKTLAVKNLIQEVFKINGINTHPNILWINARQKNVNVSEIRTISNFMHKTTYHSNLPKLIIIDYAENLNMHSFNALLKTLEEPTNNTFFILITNDLKILPDTIKSRSILLKFSLPNPSVVYHQIKQQFSNLSDVHLNEYLSLASTTGVISNLINNDTLKSYKQLLEMMYATKGASAKLYKFIETNFSTLEQLDIFSILIKNLINKLLKAKLLNIPSIISIENKIAESITVTNIQPLIKTEQEIDSFIYAVKTFGLDNKTVVLVIINKIKSFCSLNNR